jgi:hypothetical protein
MIIQKQLENNVVSSNQAQASCTRYNIMW